MAIERPRFIVIIGVVLFVMLLSAYYSYEDEDGFDSDLLGKKRSDFEKELARVEAEEDEEIRQEEKRGGTECSVTKRARHPGMIHGMKLQFVHLPKTGGSSVQMAIDEWVENNPRISLTILNSASVRGSSFKCPMRAMDKTIYIGHRGWGYCEDVEFYGGGLFTITAVRDAVSRMVSLYDYNLLKRGTDKAQRLFGETDQVTRYTLRDLVKQYNSTTDVIEPGEALLRYSGSQQVRYMCGYQCLGPNAHKNTTLTEEFMLQRALANLRKTDCVGITDHLDGLLDQMRFHLMWVPGRATTWRRQNIVPNTMKSILDEEAQAIMAKWGWTDQRLYEEAAKIAHEKTLQARKCNAKMKG